MTLIYLAGAWLLGVAAGAMAGEVWWPGLAGIATASVAAAVVMRRPQLAVVGVGEYVDLGASPLEAAQGSSSSNGALVTGRIATAMAALALMVQPGTRGDAGLLSRPSPSNSFWE